MVARSRAARPGPVWRLKRYQRLTSSIETPRYELCTQILAAIARQGGTIRAIAGNDEIMVSVTVRDGASADVAPGTVLLRMQRDGMAGERLLVNVRMADLSAFLNAHPRGDPGLEHVFDY